MRWEGRRESQNVEDRRADGGGGFSFPTGGGIRFPGGGRGGIGGGIGLIVVIGLMLLFGVDPRILLDPSMQQSPQIEIPRQNAEPGAARRPPRSASDDELRKFIGVVLADTEDVWNALLPREGRRYEEPRLVLFSGGTRSACGVGMTQMGPFYCPIDKRVYIDLAFYRELRERFRAPGDFAQAYVIAHEIGHHVQKLLGTIDKAEQLKQRMSEREANALQVRIELQADCFAGLWAHHAQRTKQVLEPGDIEEALGAASAIGDDRVQKQTQGHVVPDAFTHGTSQQRMTWFKRGFDSGNMQSCDTFSARSL